MPLHDPEDVQAEYASEAGLLGRASVYQWADGPDAHQSVFAAISDVSPRRFLDVGCGPGAVVQRVREELGADAIGLDQSQHMVELTRARGVDAVVGDAQALPFDDDAFDYVSALWMLYHVADVDRALSELARVLVPGGRLVAVTNGLDHMGELYDLAGVSRPVTTFSDMNGAELLQRHFARVERVELGGWVTFPSRREAQGYLDVSPAFFKGRSLPDLDGPVCARYSPILFVATT
jgi:SAM-dependent methyltransferase